MTRIHELLIAHTEKVSLAVLAFKRAAESWQQGDRDQLRRFVGELTAYEKEADAIRRNLVRQIARSRLSFNKKDVFRRLAHEVDDVADTAHAAGRFLLIIEDLLLAPEMKADIVKMASLDQAAMSRLAEAIGQYGVPAERRIEHISLISEMEESVDELEFKVQLEASKMNVDTWSAIMFWRLVLTVGRVADIIEDAGDELLAYEGEL